jgi:hypothetical protein
LLFNPYVSSKRRSNYSATENQSIYLKSDIAAVIIALLRTPMPTHALRANAEPY